MRKSVRLTFKKADVKTLLVMLPEIIGEARAQYDHTSSVVARADIGAFIDQMKNCKTVIEKGLAR